MKEKRKPALRRALRQGPGVGAGIMLGGALLVAPIFNDRGEVTFYVPAGCWTDLQSGKRY